MALLLAMIGGEGQGYTTDSTLSQSGVAAATILTAPLHASSPCLGPQWAVQLSCRGLEDPWLPLGDQHFIFSKLLLFVNGFCGYFLISWTIRDFVN